MKTTNYPRLNECLRAIAYFGQTDLLAVCDGEPYYEFDNGQWLCSEENLKRPDMLVELQFCLVQIAKQNSIPVDLWYGTLDGSNGKPFDAAVVGYKRDCFRIGQNGIENMAHALAVGVMKSLGLVEK